uniref:guanylate cyclase n=1 Tax=Varanus komodoensis TaxID=61221 RepID=A0A8D2KY31_VARKO
MHLFQNGLSCTAQGRMQILVEGNGKLSLSVWDTYLEHGLEFFDSEVTLKILNQNEEEELTGKTEHVIFSISQNEKAKSRHKEKANSGCVENSQEDKERGRERECVKDPFSPSLCFTGKFLHKFEPFVPERIWVEEKTFCCAFPFHIIFDETLKIKQAGINLQKFVPGLKILGTRLDKYFSIVHPQVTFTIFSICKFINSQFVLRTQRNKLPQSRKKQPALKLRGQMIWMESLQCMMYLCSPKLHSLEELEEQQMHLSDLAQHDTTRDLILFNQQRLAEIELSNQLERKKEELRILSKNLEAEKKKSETLLYTMLPKYVANQLKEGKKVEAGDFSSCTILFSDVVTFTNICSVCEPSQIVNMLNSMYSKFDRLTSVHGAYKVETIGDAYMVVGGIPVPVTSHAERVANFALGMRIAAKDVMNPITDKPMQIRIGVHTGPVLAGVVREKMPRYCLFGDTVNTASRMESHGLPDKIHVSPTAFKALPQHVFEMVERGEIENEIMGQAEVTSDKTDGKVKARGTCCPFAPRNTYLSIYLPGIFMGSAKTPTMANSITTISTDITLYLYITFFFLVSNPRRLTWLHFILTTTL